MKDNVYLDYKKACEGFLKNPKNMQKIINFFQEAKVELLRVNWPTKKQTINYTALVIIVSIVVAIFLGGLDYIFAYILKTLIIK